MSETFDVTSLVGLFQEALIALLPIMEKSRIGWRAGQAYDPWENIERTLYASIIGSCVDNAVVPGRLMPLAPYGLMRSTYGDRSFLVASDERCAAFLELTKKSEPFDEAIFLELDSSLVPSGTRIRRPLVGTRFSLAIPTEVQKLELHHQVTYAT